MLRVAIIYEDNKVYLEFSPDKFKELFKSFFEKTKDIDLTFEEIIRQIKKETQNA